MTVNFYEKVYKRLIENSLSSRLYYFIDLKMNCTRKWKVVMIVVEIPVKTPHAMVSKVFSFVQEEKLSLHFPRRCKLFRRI
jgi:hypothetical protein